jgi:hypothetical protein
LIWTMLVRGYDGSVIFNHGEGRSEFQSTRQISVPKMET